MLKRPGRLFSQKHCQAKHSLAFWGNMPSCFGGGETEAIGIGSYQKKLHWSQVAARNISAWCNI